MTRVQQVLGELATALADSGSGFALIGGLAVSVRAEPRFTRDVEATDDPEAEALLRGLVQTGYKVASTVELDATRRLATARLLPPGETQQGVVADLLFASSGIEPELAALADALEILPGLVVPVAKVGHLIALKVLSEGPDRPQDAVDLRALAEVATAADLELAKQALVLVEARGFARGKRLPDEFARLVA
jgi:hypothetical protein